MPHPSTLRLILNAAASGLVGGSVYEARGCFGSLVFGTFVCEKALPPRDSFVIGTAVINTHTVLPCLHSRSRGNPGDDLRPRRRASSCMRLWASRMFTLLGDHHSKIKVQNCMAAPPHASTRHGRGAHALAQPVSQKARQKSRLQDEPKIGAPS
jgi:hypothetical protein